MQIELLNLILTDSGSNYNVVKQQLFLAYHNEVMYHDFIIL
jgi:hypothetical protein